MLLSGAFPTMITSNVVTNTVQQNLRPKLAWDSFEKRTPERYKASALSGLMCIDMTKDTHPQMICAVMVRVLLCLTTNTVNEKKKQKHLHAIFIFFFFIELN